MALVDFTGDHWDPNHNYGSKKSREILKKRRIYCFVFSKLLIIDQLIIVLEDGCRFDGLESIVETRVMTYG